MLIKSIEINLSKSKVVIQFQPLKFEMCTYIFLLWVKSTIVSYLITCIIILELKWIVAVQFQMVIYQKVYF